MPQMKPIVVHFLASAEALRAPAKSPIENLDDTEQALTMPTMPKGMNRKV